MFFLLSFLPSCSYILLTVFFFIYSYKKHQFYLILSIWKVEMVPR